MKRLLPLSLLTFLLISCGAPSTPAPTATLTPSVTASPTIIPTATSTPEPLPTLDPYAPKEVMNPDTSKMEVFTWDKELQGFFTAAHLIDDKSGFNGTWLRRVDEFSDIPKIGSLPLESR